MGFFKQRLYCGYNEAFGFYLATFPLILSESCFLFCEHFSMFRITLPNSHFYPFLKSSYLNYLWTVVNSFRWPVFIFSSSQHFKECGICLFPSLVLLLGREPELPTTLWAAKPSGEENLSTQNLHALRGPVTQIINSLTVFSE